MKLRNLILILVLMQVACLQTAIQIAQPAPTAVPAALLSPTSTEPESGAVFELEAQNVTPETQCAIVTAIQSLNLREAPSEKSKAISWLQAREIVTVISKSDNWWKVEAESATGYARADYLKESECE